jgi:hypothetical protein
MAGEAMFGMCSLSMLKVEASIAASSPFPEGKEGQVVVVLVAGRGAVKLLTVARNSKEEVASRPLMLEEGVNLGMEMVGNRRMEKTCKSKSSVGFARSSVSSAPMTFCFSRGFLFGAGGSC